MQLSKAPTIPILSQADSITQAARIALVSRNIMIGGDVDEWDSNRGAYLQVLHTINQVQHLSGVEFKYMGRFGQNDRYVICWISHHFIFHLLIVIGIIDFQFKSNIQATFLEVLCQRTLFTNRNKDASSLMVVQTLPYLKMLLLITQDSVII